RMPMGRSPAEKSVEKKPPEEKPPTAAVTEEESIEKQIDKLVDKKELTKQEWAQVLDLIRKIPEPKKKEEIGRRVERLVFGGKIKVT
ncbi:MAG: hypothetical protein QME57_05290, partial [Patescibacteria group bacterium]|nr:hypothetical protein [Patescibacteria group bacterium]